MEYEVVVIGAGIGGLTAAAVLAKRGVKVCLLERQSYAGGCAANVEHAGYQFEPTHGLYCGWEPEGGVQSLIDALVESFRHNGGKLRLSSPVLRLAYGPDGSPIGVDLLNGERVAATRAIVSNLTIWDTYGKLIGPARTPRQMSS